jgi:hypothetical protein
VIASCKKDNGTQDLPEVSEEVAAAEPREVKREHRATLDAYRTAITYFHGSKALERVK